MEEIKRKKKLAAIEAERRGIMVEPEPPEKKRVPESLAGIQIDDRKEIKSTKKLTKKDVLNIVKDETVIYLNVNSYSKLGEPMYQLFRETMPYPIDDKFSVIGTLKKINKRFIFAIHPKFLRQTFYFNYEKERYVKKKKGKRIPAEFSSFYLPNLKYCKRSVTVRPKKKYVILNLVSGSCFFLKFP